MDKIKLAEDRNYVIIGIEPTGYYWLNIARYFKGNDYNIYSKFNAYKIDKGIK